MGLRDEICDKCDDCSCPFCKFERGFHKKLLKVNNENKRLFNSIKELAKKYANIYRRASEYAASHTDCEVRCNKLCDALDKNGVCNRCYKPYKGSYYSRDAEGVIRYCETCGKIQGSKLNWFTDLAMTK